MIPEKNKRYKADFPVLYKKMKKINEKWMMGSSRPFAQKKNV